MRQLAFIALALAATLPASAGPRDVLAGDWWGTIAERRVSLAADGTLTEFRPTDEAERKGTWEVDGDKVSICYEGRSRADTFTFAIEKDELTLTEADGRSTRLKKEARADRERRLTDILVEGTRKRRASEEEPDQFKRQQLILEARDLTGQAEPLVRSLVGADHAKQDTYVDGLVKAREPGLIEGPLPGPAEPAEIKPRASEPAGAKKKCINGLKQVGIYMALYESKFKCYPKTFDQMKRPDMLTDLSLTHCPADAAGEENKYGYVYPAKGDETPPDAICAYDTVPHKDGTRNVLLFQGRVTSMNETDFRKALADAGGKLSNSAPRARGVKASAEAKDGKVIVTIRAKIVDLSRETVDGKERVKARVIASVVVHGKPVESGVRVVAGESSADGTEVELTVVLPTADPENVESITLSVDDRVAGETGETRVEGKNVEMPK